MLRSPSLQSIWRREKRSIRTFWVQQLDPLTCCLSTMCASARGVKWSSLRSSGLLIAAFTKKSMRNRCAFLSQNAGHDLAAVIQVRIIATVIALAIGFVFQTALFEILIRAENETLTRWSGRPFSDRADDIDTPNAGLQNPPTP
jgi:hypothetical protein